MSGMFELHCLSCHILFMPCILFKESFILSPYFLLLSLETSADIFLGITVKSTLGGRLCCLKMSMKSPCKIKDKNNRFLCNRSRDPLTVCFNPFDWRKGGKWLSLVVECSIFVELVVHGGIAHFLVVHGGKR
jgi:hypothetical protein